jgi:hypothetical protein
VLTDQRRVIATAQQERLPGFEPADVVGVEQRLGRQRLAGPAVGPPMQCRSSGQSADSVQQFQLGDSG